MVAAIWLLLIWVGIEPFNSPQKNSVSHKFILMVYVLLSEEEEGRHDELIAMKVSLRLVLPDTFSCNQTNLDIHLYSIIKIEFVVRMWFTKWKAKQKLFDTINFCHGKINSKLKLLLVTRETGQYLPISDSECCPHTGVIFCRHLHLVAEDVIHWVLGGLIQDLTILGRYQRIDVMKNFLSGITCFPSVRKLWITNNIAMKYSYH